MTHPVIPPGQSAPAEFIDSTHHAGWIIISTAIGLTLFVFCLFIRLYVRLAISPITGVADYVLAGTGVKLRKFLSVLEDKNMLTPLQVFGIVQSCLVFWEASIGLGNSIELINLNDVQQLQKV